MKTYRLGTSAFVLASIGVFTLVTFMNCARLRGTADSASSTSAQSSSQLMSHDMILDEPTGYRAQSASGYAVYASTPWPGGTLPVEFRASVPASRRDLFMRQCADWAQGGQVRCVAHSTEASYVYVTNDAGACYSYVGMGVGGARTLNIADSCDDRAVLHEIGHALGLMHEHQRPDRDQYVTVHPENTTSANAYNFTLLASSERASAYDFTSIMHYDGYAFSVNGQPTIVANAGYTQNQPTMGTIPALSAADRALIATMYQPSQIIGYLDTATVAEGKVAITGWACSTGLNQSISVHLYVGGPAGTGTYVTQVTTDQPSEPGVNNACLDFSGVNHRFKFVLDQATALANVGRPIYVHGISPSGAPNLLIEKSGSLSVPDPGGGAPVVASDSVHAVYRYRNGASNSHLFSLLANEVGAPWVSEGTAFKLFDAAAASRSAVYRCFVAGSDDHFFSHDAGCEGQIQEGLVGYSENGRVSGGAPLYRCFRAGGPGHLMTTNATECLNNGFTIEFNSAPIGYVL